jgi:hypothetical protein
VTTTSGTRGRGAWNPCEWELQVVHCMNLITQYDRDNGITIPPFSLNDLPDRIRLTNHHGVLTEAIARIRRMRGL